MKLFWNAFSAKNWSFHKKWCASLCLHTLTWTIVPFVICLIAGEVFGDFGRKWLEYTVVCAGYTGICAGFFGGLLYLMRHADAEGMDTI